jgi:hypothetical protein
VENIGGDSYDLLTQNHSPEVDYSLHIMVVAVMVLMEAEEQP